MISPYDSNNKFIMINSKYNLPTFLGSRDSATYTCGRLSNIKRKLIINQYNYKTNGVGIKPAPNHVSQINTTTIKNAVKIGSIIYMIPTRFCKYIDEIRAYAKENVPFQLILDKLNEKYPLLDPLLLKIQSSNIKHTRTYPTYNKQYTNYKNVANFSAPFKLGPTVGELHNSSSFDLLFPVLKEIRYVYVSCNDAINYTYMVKDMKLNGKASFWGGKLSSNGNDLSPGMSVPVIVFPIDDIRNIMYGTFYTTKPFLSPEENSKLIFIPLTTLKDFPAHKNYYENMEFNIRTHKCYKNISIDYSKIKCKYIQHAKLYANYA